MLKYLPSPVIRLQWSIRKETFTWDYMTTDPVLRQWINEIKIKTRHVFVKHGCPRRQQSQNMAKSLSPKF